MGRGTPTTCRALFLVGDPKQAIYRFRGADIEAYTLAKSVISKAANGCLLAVTANFRSRPEVIEHVNHVFKEVLARPGQPGCVPLAPTRDPPPLPFPAAAKLTVNVSRDARAETSARPRRRRWPGCARA